MKRRQLFTPLHETAGGTENEDRRTDEQLGGEHATPALPRHLKPESASKRKNAVGGRRKSLKRLDSAKELRLLNLDFVPPGLESVPFRLGFRSEKFGYPSSRWRRRPSTQYSLTVDSWTATGVSGAGARGPLARRRGPYSSNRSLVPTDFRGAIDASGFCASRPGSRKRFTMG